jgi:hypothetical protein
MRKIGEERLIEALRALAPGVTEVAGQVLDAVDRFLATEQPDDIAMISIARKEATERPGVGEFAPARTITSST